jgi:hypothetical protein
LCKVDDSTIQNSNPEGWKSANKDRKTNLKRDKNLNEDIRA